MNDDLKTFRASVSGGDYVINADIRVRNVTLGEISDFGERAYYETLTALCATPSMYKVSLYDAGVDWTEMGDFAFFCLLRRKLWPDTTRILLGDLDLTMLTERMDNGDVKLIDPRDGRVVIDRVLYALLTDYLRRMFRMERQEEIPEDDHTKKYLVDRDRRRQQRKMKELSKSMLVPLVSGMVNLADFKYDYRTVWDLPIAAFNESVFRARKYQRYVQVMYGVYGGNVDLKKIDLRELDWLA